MGTSTEPSTGNAAHQSALPNPPTQKCNSPPSSSPDYPPAPNASTPQTARAHPNPPAPQSDSPPAPDSSAPARPPASWAGSRRCGCARGGACGRAGRAGSCRGLGCRCRLGRRRRGAISHNTSQYQPARKGGEHFGGRRTPATPRFSMAGILWPVMHPRTTKVSISTLNSDQRAVPALMGSAATHLGDPSRAP